MGPPFYSIRRDRFCICPSFRILSLFLITALFRGIFRGRQFVKGKILRRCFHATDVPGNPQLISLRSAYSFALRYAYNLTLAMPLVSPSVMPSDLASILACSISASCCRIYIRQSIMIRVPPVSRINAKTIATGMKLEISPTMAISVSTEFSRPAASSYYSTMTA